MKITQIRSVISGAAWVRQDFGGHTREEFKRADVAGRLGEKIAALRALVIAPRFARDIERRDDEIRYCEAVIARWHAAKAEPVVDTRVCTEGGPRHVYLGAPACQLCHSPRAH